MRSTCRYPLAAIILMALVGGVIAVVLFKAGTVFQFGRALVMAFIAGAVVATVVTLVMGALHRSGEQRLAELSTWPQR